MRRLRRWISYLPSALLVGALWGPTIATAQDVPLTSTRGHLSITRDEFQQQFHDHFAFTMPQQRGGTITVAERSPISHVNGLLTTEWPTRHITNLLFERLVGISPIDGAVVPQLADYWEVSPDGLTYTFHLNQQARWHDGIDVTADDVVFSFNAARSRELGVRAALGPMFEPELASYRAIDEDTFELVAKEPFVTFLYDVPYVVPIMPEHVWAEVPLAEWGDDSGSTGADPTRVIGTGPFKFQEWVHGASLTLVRNEDYYGHVPHVDTFVMRFLPQDQRLSQLKAGDLDIIEGLNGNDIQAERANGTLHFERFDVARTQVYGSNLDPERTLLFQDSRVRKALFIALDREAILKEIHSGYGELAIGTQPQISSAHAPEQMDDRYEHDPERARALLTEAGWTDSDGDGIVDKDGQDFSFAIMYNHTATDISESVREMSRSWREIGVEARGDDVSWQTFIDRQNAYDFDMFIQFWRFGPSWNQGSFFRTDAYQSGRNHMRYVNPEYDRLDDLQLREHDPERRRELLIEASRIVWNDLPVGFLYFLDGTAAWRSRVHNFVPRDFGGTFWSVPFVWVEP